MAQPGFLHLNGHMLAAVDIECTGRMPGFHEIIQIGIQPLDSHCNPSDVSPFYFHIKPEYPERAEPKATAVHNLDIDWLLLHAPDKWQVADWLDEWWTNLKLPLRKTIVPIAQNWQYEAGFLKDWLGIENFNQFFHWSARDTMQIALFLNDLAYSRAQPIPFPNNAVGLGSLCFRLGVVNENPHDALADARAEAAVYKHLIDMGKLLDV
jgi:DNA polymerase III epsilon subunit-like protein